MAKRDLSEMSTSELHQTIDREVAAAARKAAPSLMRAWSAAVHAGHRGSFSDWLSLALDEHLKDEAHRVANEIPANVRTAAAHSPWYGRKAG